MRIVSRALVALSGCALAALALAPTSDAAPETAAKSVTKSACSGWVSAGSAGLAVRACLYATRTTPDPQVRAAMVYKLYVRNTSKVNVKATYEESYLYGGQYSKNPAYYVLEHRGGQTSRIIKPTASTGALYLQVKQAGSQGDTYDKLDWFWDGADQNGHDAVVKLRF